jgi:RimJ/RimL family protein N-acetyltransferase
MPAMTAADASTTTLADGTLLLRPYQAADAAILHQAVIESVDSVGRWLPWCHAGYGLDDSRAWIEHCGCGWRDGSQYALAIFEAGTFAGGIGINRIDPLHRNGNLGYWLRQSRQRRGLAARAGRLAAAFAFARLDLVRLEIACAVDNQPSRRTAEAIGARFECIARNRLMDGATPVAAAVYGLVPQDLA